MIYLLESPMELHKRLVRLSGEGIAIINRLRTFVPVLLTSLDRELLRTQSRELDLNMNRWLDEVEGTVRQGVRAGSHTVALDREIISPDHPKRFHLEIELLVQSEESGHSDNRQLLDYLHGAVKKPLAVVTGVVDCLSVILRDIEDLPPESEFRADIDEFLLAVSKQVSKVRDAIDSLNAMERITAAQVDDLWTSLLVDDQIAAPELRFLERHGPRGLALAARKIRKG